MESRIMYQTIVARIAMISLMMISGTVVFGEEVENPSYTNWARFPVGTKVVTKAVTTQNGQSVQSITTTTLVRKNEKSLLLTWFVSSDGTGKLIQNDVNELKVNRMFPLFPGVDKTKIGRPQGVKSQGFETIEVLGKKYNAEWYETNASTEAGPSVTKTWISMDMPGQVIRSVTEVKAASKKVFLEVTEFVTGDQK